MGASLMIEDPKPKHPEYKAIIHQLEHMLDSPNFTATPQQRALLKYVVNQTLAASPISIKASIRS